MNIRKISTPSLFALLLLFVAGCCFPLSNFGGNKQDIPSDKVTPSSSLKLLDGKEVDLNDYKGKPLVINFWATWCSPCRQEIPALIATYEKYKNRVQFIAIAVSSDKEEDVRTFVKNNAVSYPVGMDTSGKIANDYKVTGIPTTFFVNKNGEISDSHTGAMNESQLSEKIEELLK